MGTSLEGYLASGGGYALVEQVQGTDRGRQLRSRALGLDLRSRSRDAATVLVFCDPETGEEFDGALETAEQRRRAAENRAGAAEGRVRVLEQRLRNLAAHTPPPERDPWRRVRPRGVWPVGGKSRPFAPRRIPLTFDLGPPVPHATGLPVLALTIELGFGRSMSAPVARGEASQAV